MYPLHVKFIEKCKDYILMNNLDIFWIQLSSIGAYGKPKKYPI